MSVSIASLEELSINTIRGLSLDGVEAAKSGHAGLPLGAAPMAYVLWTKHLKFNPKDPHWIDRDRFILSAGHGSMLLYSLLHLTGFDLPLDELKHFRQLHSKTPGHPEIHLTPGVEMSTGPLGQGVAHSVGFAIAESFLAATYNRPGFDLIDHHTYAICSDGDLMEGVSNEAASLAGHLQLGKLLWLYDDNGISIDGKTEITFTEDVEVRFKGLGWHTQRIDGMDTEAVEKAILAAQAVTDKPSIILAKTVIGFGSPKLAGTNKAHSNPFGPEELKATKEALGIPQEPTFYISDDVSRHFLSVGEAGAKVQSEWEQKFAAYATAYPKEAAELQAAISGDLGTAWLEALPTISDKVATRKASEMVINAIAPHLPTLMGGSADLAESNLTTQKGAGVFQPESRAGKNLDFGVREHATIAAVNGLTIHGATRAFGASFMVFSDYARPSIRLGALQHIPAIYVFTHDSIGVGEDGPTHEPVEHLMSLRAIPNLNVFRPADGYETAVAWKIALEATSTPTFLALSRQALPALTPSDVRNHPAEKGGYVVSEATGGAPQLILIGTGSELQHVAKARETLEAEGIPTRVVSLPSWFLFEKQGKEYINSILPKDIPTLSVEAGSTLAWPRYSDAQIGVDTFGLSGPGDAVMKEFGFTPENVVVCAKALLAGS
jgi:transketolase